MSIREHCSNCGRLAHIGTCIKPFPKRKRKSKRCEGWHRHGGAFTLGPVSWSQCKNTGIVILTVRQEGKTKDWPACKECWALALGLGVKILKAKPL